MADIHKVETGPRTAQSGSRLWRYAPLALWLAVIFFASTDELSGSKTTLVIEPFLRWLFPHITAQRVHLVHLLVRKAAHFSEYAILGLFAARAFRTSRHTLLRANWFPAALALIGVYALLDEYHQSFVPSRTASIYDSMVDVAGGLTVLVAIGLWQATRKRRTTRRRQSNSQLSGIEQ